MDQSSKRPKILETVDCLSEMSKFFDQIMILTDTLDQLVETEISPEKLKVDVKSFVTNFERLVKTYTSHEMILTSYFKEDDELDFSNISLHDDDASSNKSKVSEKISLRPQTSTSETIFEKIPVSMDREIMKLHGETMKRLFSLTNTKEMIVDKSRIYPRIHFLHGANPVEVRDLYDFCSIATIYMTTPDFLEIEKLPGWIKDGVKDNFGNNPMIKINDTLALDFFSASPDFDESQNYLVWHFIKMRKVRYEKSMISNTEKIFKRFIEENVHYLRGLGLIIVKGHMENALKKPFKSYGKPNRMGSVMISVDCRSTPDSARRFLLKKISMIENGEIDSSPQALYYVEKRLAENDSPTRFGARKWVKNVKIESD